MAAEKSFTTKQLADPRFVAYYDGACGEGAAAFLRDIIHANIPEE